MKYYNLLLFLLFLIFNLVTIGLGATNACTPSSCPEYKCFNSTCNGNQCSYKFYQCPAINNDLCTRGICNTTTGSCNYSPVECPPANKCSTSIGCNKATGFCQYRSLPCPPSSDPCSQAVGCDETSGNCTYQKITCPNHSNPCMKSMGCIASLGGRCQYQSINCTSSDLCSVGKCNNQTGSCEFSPIVCPKHSNPCMKSLGCNSTIGGKCQYQSTDCTSTDLCSVGKCNNQTGSCEFSPVVCPTHSNPCMKSIGCNSSIGKCQYQSTNCTSTDLCSVGKCNNQTGSCEFSPVVCQDPPPCYKSMGCVNGRCGYVNTGDC
ncbi:hypothetical protein ACTFIR_000981 [Dictyostelium discoideum]